MTFILVYNVSHTDLILGAESGTNTNIISSNPVKTPRPSSSNSAGTFSRHASSNSILNTPTPPMITLGADDSSSQKTIINLCRPKFSFYQPIAEAFLNSWLTAKRADQVSDLYAPLHATQDSQTVLQDVAVGISLPQNLSVTFDADGRPWDFRNLHTRRSSSSVGGEAAATTNSFATIRALYLPLFAQLVPLWLSTIKDSNALKVIIILCGAGRPRNPDHPSRGNSTQGLAVIMREFAARHFPDVKVITLDSGLDVFKYDENVIYVRNHLLPILEQYRRRLVSLYAGDWKQKLKVTIALTDGPSARIGAINASLRSYHPSYLHAWQLKTFWHEYRLIESDVQFVSFDSVETISSQPVNILDQDARHLVHEMQQYKDYIIKSLANGSLSELGEFWLRKSRKPVIAVLMLRKTPNGPPIFFRGINMEVSMPTGSLCAERNVIGSALASDVTLKRSHLQMIAVLSLSLNMHHLSSPSSSSSTTTTTTTSSSSSSSSIHTIHEASSATTDVEFSSGKRPRLQSIEDSGSFHHPHHSSSMEDLNPMDPCGACVEWLRKIAEYQPDFKVLTFTSWSCEHVYIKEVSME